MTNGNRKNLNNDNILNEILPLLTENQASLLYRFSQGENSSGMVKNQSEAATAKSLRDLGVIREFGRRGEKIRWQVVSELFPPENRKFLKELVGVNVH